MVAGRYPKAKTANDLEAAARAALVDGRDTSEKSSAERLEDVVDKVTADRKADAQRQEMTAAEQRAEFEKVAREHGEATFDSAMRKLMKPKRGE